MQETPLPANEEDRLHALENLCLLYTPAEEGYDRITRMACRLFNVPISLISLIHRETQWFKSRQGVDISETPRSTSFCSHALLGEGVFVINNAKDGKQLIANQLGTFDPDIQFYAGCPVRGPRGFKVGVLCIIDRLPREFSAADQQNLRDIAYWVESELRNVTLGQSQQELTRLLDSARRQALIDPLTQTWNRKGMDRIIVQEIKRSCRESNGFGLLMMDLDHFKSINDTYGHQAGDDVLRRTCQRIRKSLRAYDALGRYGGEEFLVVTPRCGNIEARGIAEKIRAAIGDSPIIIEQIKIPVTISIGVTAFTCQVEDTARRVIGRADEALYRAKAEGRNQVVVHQAV